MTLKVQVFVGRDHFWHDPGAVLSGARRLRTALYHLRKITVKTQLKCRIQQAALEALPQ
jgi:hypothetical protein